MSSATPSSKQHVVESPTRWLRPLILARHDVVYDAGVLVAAERNDRQVWADHRVRLEVGVVPTTTAPVVAQVSRSYRQAQLRRLLRGCDIVAFAPEQAHPVGALLGKARTSDVVDASDVATTRVEGSIGPGQDAMS